MESDLQMNAALAQKLQKVMEQVPFIEKKGTNTHFKYDFVTEPDVLNAVRTECVKVGLVLLPSILTHQHEGPKTIISGQVEIIDTQTGWSIKCLFAGEANDAQDKGTSKALVSGLKYWLLKAFMIPSGVDPDADGAVKEAKGKKADAGRSVAAQAPLKPSQAELDRAGEFLKSCGLGREGFTDFKTRCLDKGLEWVAVAHQAEKAKVTGGDLFHWLDQREGANV